MSNVAHKVPDYCEGERCRVCGKPATHKIEEALENDDWRHPFTAYICCIHFGALMGPLAREYCQVKVE